MCEMKYVCNFTHLTPRAGGRSKNLGGHTFEISQKKVGRSCVIQNIGWENAHSAHPFGKIAHPFPLALLSGCEKILALHVAKWSHKIRHFDTLTLLTGNFR